MPKPAILSPISKRGRSNRHRNIVLGLIIIFILTAIFLLYLYLKMLEPKRSVNRPVLKNYNWVTSIYGISETDRFKRPHDVAVDRQGNIYVADSGNARVVKLDNKGNYVKTIGKVFNAKSSVPPTDSREFLANPLGVSVDPLNGDVYVTDRNLHKIVIYDQNGRYKKSWMVMMPLIPKVTGDRIYLTTYGPVFVYDKNGKEVAKWGRRGRDSKNFDFPSGVEADKEGNVYVSDANNNMLKALRKDGSLLYAIGGKSGKASPGTSIKLDLPQGLTYDDQGLLYAVDAFRFNIRVFSNADKKPVEVTAIGTYGNYDGQFMYPSGIEYLGNRRFAVADEGNNRVQIIHVPMSREMVKAAGINSKSLRNDLIQSHSAVAYITDLFDRLVMFLGL